MRLLVIRLTALGDLVLAQPALSALRARFPGAAIHLVTEERFAAFAREAFADAVDAVIGYDRRGADRGLSGMTRVLSRLPLGEYDAVVDLQGKARTRLFARRVPAQRRLVLEKRTALEAVRAVLGADVPIHDRHASAIYLEALAPLGVSAREEAPRLKKPAPLDLPRGAIGLAPGATHATKRWPAHRFAEVAEELAAVHPSACFLLVGGPSDRALCAEVRAKAARARFLELDVTELDVLGLARAIAALDLFIGVDSGPAHIAAAFGVPVVAIFGPTSSVRWGPRGEQHRVVSLQLACAPCTNFGGEVCPLPTRSHECMQALGAHEVAEAALASLARRGEGR